MVLEQEVLILPIALRMRAAAAATVAAAVLEAIRAVDGLVAGGLEGDLGFFAAARARRAEHFALSTATRAAAVRRSAVAAAAVGGAAVALRLARGPAVRA